MKNKWLLMAGLGFELTGLVVGSVFLGQWLDLKLESRGLVTAGLIVISFSLWVLRIMKALGKTKSDTE